MLNHTEITCTELIEYPYSLPVAALYSFALIYATGTHNTCVRVHLNRMYLSRILVFCPLNAHYLSSYIASRFMPQLATTVRAVNVFELTCTELLDCVSSAPLATRCLTSCTASRFNPQARHFWYLPTVHLCKLTCTELLGCASSAPLAARCLSSCTASRFMPQARHFWYRQYWHRFRCRLSMMQFRSSRHAYVRSFRTVLLKKPLQPSQLERRNFYLVTKLCHELMSLLYCK